MARSNRQLTQFAVDTLREFLDRKTVYETRTAGNTQVYAAPSGGRVHYWVELFGEEILRLGH